MNESSLPPFALSDVVGEVEAHVAEAGWDQPPQLFALAETEELLRREPQLAASMEIVAPRPGTLTPILQEPLSEGPLDQVLARIQFEEPVLGVVLVHEVLLLPPSAEQDIDGAEDPTAAAAAHDQRREARMAVGVVRGGGEITVLRLRGATPEQDERVTGKDLATNMVAALRATLE